MLDRNQSALARELEEALNNATRLVAEGKDWADRVRSNWADACLGCDSKDDKDDIEGRSQQVDR
jgi:hypothetical protein